ncbi:hypothetical protein QBC37DRAFT_243184, partial [Rhypophila decipiens]
MLTGKALDYYHNRLSREQRSNMLWSMNALSENFETDEIKLSYLQEWQTMSYAKIVEKNPEKTRLECLEMLFDELTKIQRALPPTYQSDYTLRDQLVQATRGTLECANAMFAPAGTFEGVRAQLRNSVRLYVDTHPTSGSYPVQNDGYVYDRKFNHSNGRGPQQGYQGNRGSDRPRGNYQGNNRPNNNFRPPNNNRKCYICGKPGHYARMHKGGDRRGWKQYSSNPKARGRSRDDYQQFLTWYEGDGNDLDPHDVYYNSDTEYEEEEGQDEEDGGAPINESHFMEFETSMGTTDSYTVAGIMEDSSIRHLLTAEDPYNDDPAAATVFVTGDRYNSGIFRGIMPDT